MSCHALTLHNFTLSYQILIIYGMWTLMMFLNLTVNLYGTMQNLFESSIIIIISCSGSMAGWSALFFKIDEYFDIFWKWRQIVPWKIYPTVFPLQNSTIVWFCGGWQGHKQCYQIMYHNFTKKPQCSLSWILYSFFLLKHESQAELL